MFNGFPGFDKSISSGKTIGSSFSSKGSFAGYETNVTYTKKTNELAMLQKALRGSNQFYKCSEPKLIKEE